MHSRFTDDLVRRAREIYLGNEHLTLRELSKQSANLLGQETGYDRLKDWATVGYWRVEKKRKYPTPSSISDEVDHIRRIVYNQIVTAATSGLYLSGEFDKEAVLRAIADIPGIKISKIKPQALDLSAVNAYTNLLARIKVAVHAPEASAKTDREKAMELIREVQEEHGE